MQKYSLHIRDIYINYKILKKKNNYTSSACIVPLDHITECVSIYLLHLNILHNLIFDTTSTYIVKKLKYSFWKSDIITDILLFLFGRKRKHTK